jgi:hypothetical protein
MITECFSQYDAFSGGREEEQDSIGGEQDSIGGEPKGESNGEGDYLEDASSFFEDSRRPLYHASNSNRLAARLLLLNCFAVFGVSNAAADEILRLLKELLPTGNTLLGTHYEARKYLKRLGLLFHPIHACWKGCCLFHKELKDAENCPKGRKSRYASPRSRRLTKVLRHFPVIPRLKRMF